MRRLKCQWCNFQVTIMRVPRPKSWGHRCDGLHGVIPFVWMENLMPYEFSRGGTFFAHPNTATVQ